jgi:RHS repeat-associated protein
MGLYWISATSTTKLCIREGHDALDIRGTGLTSTVKKSVVTFRSSESTGTANDPFLDVTYVTSTSSATTTQGFATSTVSTPNLLQDISYSYDAVGNIVQSAESAPTLNMRSSTYGYDYLNRLTSSVDTIGASTTVQSFVYNPLGNITNLNGVSIQYEGTGYANPHAPTQFGSTLNIYDQSGNLSQSGSTLNTWNYNDALSQVSGVEVATTTFSYGFDSSRVHVVSSGIATFYPSKNYNIEGTKSIMHIFSGPTALASVENSLGNTTLRYITSDHLGGSSVVTDSSGVIVEVTDYHPYGATRIDAKSSSFSEQRKFTGHEFDSSTGLTYQGSRYYSGSRGSFISEDPLSRSLGMSSRSESLMNDPQMLNMYSYARGNPLMYTDEYGENPALLVPAILGYYAGYAGAMLGDYRNGASGSEMYRHASDFTYVNEGLRDAAIGIAATEGFFGLVGATVLGGGFLNVNGREGNYQTPTQILTKGLLGGTLNSAIGPVVDPAVKGLNPAVGGLVSKLVDSGLSGDAGEVMNMTGVSQYVENIPSLGNGSEVPRHQSYDFSKTTTSDMTSAFVQLGQGLFGFTPEKKSSGKSK